MTVKRNDQRLLSRGSIFEMKMEEAVRRIWFLKLGTALVASESFLESFSRLPFHGLELHSLDRPDLGSLSLWIVTLH